MTYYEHFLPIPSNEGTEDDNLYDVIGYDNKGNITKVYCKGMKLGHALALVYEYEANGSPIDE